MSECGRPPLPPGSASSCSPHQKSDPNSPAQRSDAHGASQRSSAALSRAASNVQSPSQYSSDAPSRTGVLLDEVDCQHAGRSLHTEPAWGAGIPPPPPQTPAHRDMSDAASMFSAAAAGSPVLTADWSAPAIRGRGFAAADASVLQSPHGQQGTSQTNALQGELHMSLALGSDMASIGAASSSVAPPLRSCGATDAASLQSHKSLALALGADVASIGLAQSARQRSQSDAPIGVGSPTHSLAVACCDAAVQTEATRHVEAEANCCRAVRDELRQSQRRLLIERAKGVRREGGAVEVRVPWAVEVPAAAPRPMEMVGTVSEGVKAVDALCTSLGAEEVQRLVRRWDLIAAAQGTAGVAEAPTGDHVAPGRSGRTPAGRTKDEGSRPSSPGVISPAHRPVPPTGPLRPAADPQPIPAACNKSPLQEIPAAPAPLRHGKEIGPSVLAPLDLNAALCTEGKAVDGKRRWRHVTEISPRAAPVTATGATMLPRSVDPALAPSFPWDHPTCDAHQACPSEVAVLHVSRPVGPARAGVRRHTPTPGDASDTGSLHGARVTASDTPRFVDPGSAAGSPRSGLVVQASRAGDLGAQASDTPRFMDPSGAAFPSHGLTVDRAPARTPSGEALQSVRHRFASHTPRFTDPGAADVPASPGAACVVPPPTALRVAGVSEGDSVRGARTHAPDALQFVDPGSSVNGSSAPGGDRFAARLSASVQGSAEPLSVGSVDGGGGSDAILSAPACSSGPSPLPSGRCAAPTPITDCFVAPERVGSIAQFGSAQPVIASSPMPCADARVPSSIDDIPRFVDPASLRCAPPAGLGLQETPLFAFEAAASAPPVGAAPRAASPGAATAPPSPGASLARLRARDITSPPLPQEGSGRAGRR
eukprot:TRINITY_DN14994_c0_g1_i1.p1 TRINITY_DN14994_c0_g1~~TRINITY_DN14994_c0_g1_i1.p1  ORF type:complete len:1034 (+),score=63.12 TRINITY_DN14994_c0_g1_i1:467-3103(+)